MPRKVPFDWNRRVQLARTYLDDGANLTAAARLEAMADDMRRAYLSTMADLGRRGLSDRTRKAVVDDLIKMLASHVPDLDRGVSEADHMRVFLDAGADSVSVPRHVALRLVELMGTLS